MSEARLGQDSESHRGSSDEGNSIRMEENPTRQAGTRNFVQPPEQAEPLRAAPNVPNAQNPQVECLLTAKELFDQLVTKTKRDQLNVQKASARPPSNSSITPTVLNKDPRQTQSGNRGRGRGSHSNASTRQESRAPARNYHLRGRECSDDIAGTTKLNLNPANTLMI
ncbi:hypothetical protein V6N11_028648 [Hibiscus sabdariffa]|uniref:Gag-Pol polyprotein n=1 Tax=Hibiscus sabdariffa TaxID=183260 RepID=A0ABR2PQG0_9ROSI